MAAAGTLDAHTPKGLPEPAQRLTAHGSGGLADRTGGQRAFFPLGSKQSSHGSKLNRLNTRALLTKVYVVILKCERHTCNLKS